MSRLSFSEFVNGVRALGSRAGAKSPEQQIESDRSEFYQALRYVLNYNSRPKQFFYSGDTLYVDRLNGPLPVYIKLGNDSNPWIRIREGMVLRRKFTRLTIRSGDVTSPATFQAVKTTDILLYVSWGDFMVSLPPKEYGAKKGAAMWRDTATTTETDLFRYLDGGANFLETVGIGGGFVMVRNNSTWDRLWLRYGSAGGSVDEIGARIFPIGPGETLTIPLEQRAISRVTGSGFLSTSDGWTIQAEASSVPFYVMVSACEFDSFDPYSTIPEGV